MTGEGSAHDGRITRRHLRGVVLIEDDGVCFGPPRQIEFRVQRQRYRPHDRRSPWAAGRKD